MNIFGKKPTMKEQLRANDRALKKTTRDIEKDRRELERQEKQLEMEIKKAAKLGNKQACTVLAKQLVQIRKQKTRTYSATSKIQSIGAQSKSMASNVKLAGAMGETAKTMGAMNKQMNPQKMMQTMQQFDKENTKMNMTEEMMDDTLNDMLEESDDEEEQDAVVNKVLDEIGIEISGKLSEAPSAHKSSLSVASTSRVTDDDIEKQLAQLKT
ncbi:Charged multivesicular body protein 2b [Nymphon striatum]|nr:Charged multivesicular body protein 2b [Nymphon striatum]